MKRRSSFPPGSVSESGFTALDELTLEAMRHLQCKTNPIVKAPLGERFRFQVHYCRDKDKPCPPQRYVAN